MAERAKAKDGRRSLADSMVLTGIFLAVAYWGLEALINLFSPNEISFYREIFGPNVSGMGTRIVALCLFVIFGSHVQYTINHRREAERALRESEEKYRSILESIEEGYYETGLDGTITFVNDATGRIFGRPRNALLGMRFEDLMGEAEGRKIAEVFRGCLQTGRSVKAFDCELRKQDGEVLQLEASAAPRRNHASAPLGLRGLLRDRTEKRKLELDLLASARKLHNARAATILGLAKLAEYRDEGTGTHLERIREYARLLAAEMSRRPPWKGRIDQGFVDDIFQSAILHDIGKVGIPDAVLLKPGGLTEEEFEVIKCHTLFGGDAIAAIEKQIEGRSFLNTGREIAYCHHEKWDGTGYPRGLKGEAIPLAARIVALADVYDALTTKRFYKEAFSHERACEIIGERKGTHFDPLVVEVFLEVAAEFDRIRRDKLDQESAADGREGVCRPAAAALARREAPAHALMAAASAPRSSSRAAGRQEL